MVKFGEYITIFSLEYFIYIGILVVCAWLLFSHRAWVRQQPEKVSSAILIVSIGQQVLLYSSYLYLFDFSLGESLPFHLSRISSILGIIYLLPKNKRVFTILCYLSLFAWLSFAYPSRVYGVFHPIGISFVVNHVITLLLPFFWDDCLSTSTRVQGSVAGIWLFDRVYGVLFGVEPFGRWQLFLLEASAYFY